jgi:glycosyltransferase involved in cell wall biosynthesis
MRWLIVEDALRDRKGHWLEWVTTFNHGFRELGDSVTVLADSEVEKDIRESLQAEAILPRSIWHRLGDGSGPLTRYSRVFTHNLETWRVMDRYLRDHPDFDAIFVPTVSVHHLWAWVRLIKGVLRSRKTKVLLFFLTFPASIDSKGNVVSDGSPTARLLVSLMRSIGAEVRDGKVVLGVETKAMRKAWERLTGIPFVWFPQPVATAVRNARRSGEWIEMACFGAARAEKGSEILQEAIEMHLHQFPSSRARFTVQWIDDFQAGGKLAVKSAMLQNNSRMRFVTRYFGDGEYAKYLTGTDVMLLPYRLASYGLRGSRVVLEAAVNSIPVVVTRGTTLASVAEDMGTGVLCEDGDARSLACAIAEMETRFEEMSRSAASKSAYAAELFSVAEFRRIFSLPTRAVLEESVDTVVASVYRPPQI